MIGDITGDSLKTGFGLKFILTSDLMTIYKISVKKKDCFIQKCIDFTSLDDVLYFKLSIMKSVHSLVCLIFITVHYFFTFFIIFLNYDQ